MHGVIESFLRARGATLSPEDALQVSYLSSQRLPQEHQQARRSAAIVQRSGVICHRCGGRGHVIKDCPSKEMSAGGGRPDGKATDVATGKEHRTSAGSSGLIIDGARC